MRASLVTVIIVLVSHLLAEWRELPFSPQPLDNGIPSAQGVEPHDPPTGSLALALRLLAGRKLGWAQAISNELSSPLFRAFEHIINLYFF